MTVHCGATTRAGTPCRRPAGWGTDHVGEGRCKLHGGLNPVKTGRYSRIKRARVRELIDEFKQDPQPLDLTDEVLLLRALLTDFVERYDEMSDGIHRWHASFQQDYLDARLRWLQDVQSQTIPEIHGLHNAVLASIDLLVDLQGRDEALDTVIDQALEVLRGSITASRKKQNQLPRAPDPLEFVNKPRQLLDITAAAGLVDKVGRMVERIEKIRSEGTITLEALDKVLERLGAELVIALREEVPDEDARTQILRLVWDRWYSIRVDPTPPPRGRRGDQLPN